MLIGETMGWLGASLYLRDIVGGADGAPPPVDLAAERRNGDFVRSLIRGGRIEACHDLSDGGLIVALTEMALAGGIGAEIARPSGAPALHGWLFGEDQARYLLAVSDGAAIAADAKQAGVPAAIIGRSGGDSLTVDSVHTISIDRLRRRHEDWLPSYMAG